MCLAIPGKVVEIIEDTPLTRQARVSFDGVIKSISLALLPEATVGEYVLIHAGVAISVVDEEEAQETFAYLKEIDELELPEEFSS
ncbi:MAG: HypC/HybG/HupF family hydrogenase formation chaperone [Candidatus Hydrogenedentes bacterium]|nr:HypC/HybG/HupF family hydrogenase formation chaperone [Candidatus Hydrogenedentota bacterium]